MGNPNKYSDGLSYLLFPANISNGTCGYNFPESTAQDIAGSISLSFSGSQLPYGGSTSNTYKGFYRGPSGFAARYTPMVVMTAGAFQNFNSQVITADTFGAPDLRSIFGVYDNSVTEASTSQRFRNGRAYNSIGQVEILDLISEGPIEGFVTGTYTYSLSGKTTGDIGYASAKFQQYSTNYSYSKPETRSIYWSDVPITDFEGFYNFQFVDYKYTYGQKTNDHTVYNPYLNLYEFRTNYFGKQVDQNQIPLQTSITKYYGDNLYGLYIISGANKIVTPKTYYIYNINVSSIKVAIEVDALYEAIVTGISQGDVEKQNLDLKFSIYRILDNGSLVSLDTSKYNPYISDYFSRDIISAEGKIQSSPVVITYHFNLRPFSENTPNFPLFQNQIGWAIDVTKITLENTSSTLVSKTKVGSITEVYSDRFTYPDAALVYSKFDARYFSDIPSRSYKVRLLKVKIPVNYDPISKTYNGPWNGKFKIAWTDNPAWCFYDILSNNRYGLGKYINAELTDKWTLYEIAQYCDQLVSDGFGGLEPRFTCNIYINTKEEAAKVLSDMASVFLAIIYYSSGLISLSQDSLKNPIYLFNNSNVIDGDFRYSDASLKSKKTIATVRYNDKNDNYKPAIEYIEDRNGILKYGIRETEIVAFGCTSKNQARRVGKWLLATENLETEMIEFNLGLEGNYIRPGDIISVYDQYRRNPSYAGRTVELTTGYAILDLPYDYINTYAITGVNVNNSIKFNVITPTYNLNFGTQLGDLYATGFSIGSSGTTGLNSSFIRKSQLQSIDIYNPQNYLTSGSGIYSNNIRINFPTSLLTSGYTLSQNSAWNIDVNTSNYSQAGMNTESPINNPSRYKYPGYYLESYLNKPKNYRVINVNQAEDNKFSINALEYNSQKYADIDNAAILVNKPIRPNTPNAPSLYLTGIFRTPNLDFNTGYLNMDGTLGGHYITNQGGINSVMYNITPDKNDALDNLYYVYVKPDFNYLNLEDAPQIYLYNVLNYQGLRTGLSQIDWQNGTIPPYLTPTGIGNYYFKIFTANSIGELSSPATGVYNLTAQASSTTVQASGRNIY
jgi:hypothetical protein